MEAESEADRRYTNSYPECDPWGLTSVSFPASDAIYQDIGQSFGGFITPAIGRSDGMSLLWKLPKNLCKSSSIAKCIKCGAYINEYSDISYHRWACSLCGHRSGVLPAKSRYRTERRYLPELNEGLVDFPAPLLSDIQDADAITDSESSGGGWWFSDSSLVNNNGYNDGTGKGGTSTTGISNIMSEFVSRRPLVHVFLLQEQMDSDCLETVVDAITLACKNVHPDMSVVLLTFGSRIAVYRLLDRLPHAVKQYIHIVRMPTCKGLDTWSGAGAVSGIIDGWDSRELFPPPLPRAQTQVTASSGSDASSRTSKAQEKKGYYLMPMMPLQCSLDFMKTRSRMGDCRVSLRAALQSLPLDVTKCGDSGQEPSPKLMLGPALHAVLEWLTAVYCPDLAEGSHSEFSQLFDESQYRERMFTPETSFATVSPLGGGSTSAGNGEAAAVAGVSVFGSVMNSLAGAFRSGLGLSEESVGSGSGRLSSSSSINYSVSASKRSSVSEQGVESGTAAARTQHLSPVGRCSGVQLHVFISHYSNSDTEEVVSEEVEHASLRPSKSNKVSGATRPRSRNYCSRWAQKLGNFCAEKSICVNVFSVLSFDNDRTNNSGSFGDLLKLRMLSDVTGGKVYPLYINQDKAGTTRKLSALLSHVLAHTQYSTKGLLKLRGTAAVLDTEGTKLQGPCVLAVDTSPVDAGNSNDNNIPSRQVFGDLYRLPCMSPTSNVSFVAQYYRDAEVLPRAGAYGTGKGIRTIVLQCAYSYETIVESEVDLPARPPMKKTRILAAAAPVATPVTTPDMTPTTALADIEKSVDVAPVPPGKTPAVGGGLVPALHTPLIPSPGAVITGAIADPATTMAVSLTESVQAPLISSIRQPEQAPAPVVNAPTTTIINKYKITRPPPRPALRTQAALAVAKTPSPTPEPLAAPTPVSLLVSSSEPEPVTAQTLPSPPDPAPEVIATSMYPPPPAPPPMTTTSTIPAMRSDVFDGLGLRNHIIDMQLLEHMQQALSEHVGGHIDPHRIGINCQDRDEIRSNKAAQAATLLDSYHSLSAVLSRTAEEVSAAEIDPAVASESDTYECIYSHGKALVAVRRLRVLTIAVNCGSTNSIQGLIRGILPTNHAFLTLRSLLLSPMPSNSDNGVDGSAQMLSYNSANVTSSTICGWLIRYRQELAVASHTGVSPVGVGLSDRRLEMITSCPLFLHISSLLSSYTLILFDEFNVNSNSRNKGRGRSAGRTTDDTNPDANEMQTSTVESMLNEVLLAPQIQYLLHLLHGMQDSLSRCVKIMSYRHPHSDSNTNTNNAIDDDEEDEDAVADELLDLLASSDQFAHLLSLVFSGDPHLLDRYFYPKLYGLDRDLLMVNPQRPTEEINRGVSSLLPLQRQAMLTGGNYAAFLMDTGFKLMIYRPMLSGLSNSNNSTSGGGDMRVDVLESDDWVVNDVLRRCSVNPTSALTDCIHAESGTTNSEVFNRCMLDDNAFGGLSFTEYEGLLRKTVIAKIHAVL